MRVVNRAEFLALPAGTIYAKGKPWHFEGVTIKGDSLADDWIYLDLAWPESSGDMDSFDKLAAMLSEGASFPMQESYGRDGCFDAEEIFLVWERADLLALVAHINAALDTTPD
jgi:hypothetical protein